MRDLIFCFILIIISIVDIKRRKIPNVGIILLALFPLSSFHWRSCLMCIVLLLLPMMYFAEGGKIGGGDIKLVAVIGFYLGYIQATIMLFIAVGLCVLYYFILYMTKNHTEWKLPLAPFLSLGTIITIIFLGGHFL